MNPPYLSTRTMDDTTAAFLREHYADCAGDLYTAFMQLATALLKPDGRLSTIVQQSFLSIRKYRQFRLDLFEQTNIVSCVQLGTGAFPSRPGEKVNTAIVTLQKRASKDKDDNFEIKYLRLQGKSDLEEAKNRGLEQCAHETIKRSAAVNLISLLPGQAFAFHCPEEVAGIFAKETSIEQLKDDFVLTNGLFTCDNSRFVKLASQLSEAEVREGLYVPYDKGGGRKWYHQTPYVLNWGDDGQAVRDFRFARGQSRGLPGEAFYFKPGITYSYIGTKGFKARLLSPNCVFDIASSAIFSQRYDLHYVLGFFNSALVAYLLSILNPTINFQIGDLRKLPFKAPTESLQSEVAKLAAEAVEIMKQIPPPKNSDGDINGIDLDLKQMMERESEIQAQIDSLLFDHYKISSRTRRQILEDGWVKHSRTLLY